MRILVTLAATVFATLAVGCNTAEHDHHGHGHAAQMAKIDAAVCVLHATKGNNVSGTVEFYQVESKVKIFALVSGLTPNQKHAIHIHEFGDCTSPDGKSAGGHYNPEGHDHGLPDAGHRHAGDLGNLQADANGNAKQVIWVDNVSVAGLKNPILGRSIIVHAKTDDGGQPTGNAGPRIACGVIGVKKPGK